MENYLEAMEAIENATDLGMLAAICKHIFELKEKHQYMDYDGIPTNGRIFPASHEGLLWDEYRMQKHIFEAELDEKNKELAKEILGLIGSTNDPEHLKMLKRKIWGVDLSKDKRVNLRRQCDRKVRELNKAARQA